jgi:transcriptional regulator of acetoin/glycerol metabolism
MPVVYREHRLDARPNSLKSFIVESHARCQYLGLKTFESCDYSAQLPADFRITLERSERLIAQATAVLTMLGKSVADFGSMIVLTDGTGTILRTQCQSTFIEQAEKVALRPGVSWAESSKGTNAVGTALILESDIYVQGDDHYLQSNHVLSCAASPILDHSGNVIGVLDASGDKRSFHPHTLALVEMCARTIENNWFRDKFRQTLQLHFHNMAELIGTAEEGIVAFSEDGQVLGANRAGLKILEISASTLRIRGLRMLFGFGFGELMDKLRQAMFTPLKLQQINGKDIFVRVSWNDTSIFSNTVNTPFTHVHPSRAIAAPSLPLPNASPTAREATYQLDELGAGDAQVRLVAQKVRQIIDKDISILIIGETGTGKERLANAIHQFSQRRNYPFIAINCASIPEQLIESELFGYEEGAFTGAKRKGGVGKLLQANGGTLFLDEIGDMPLSLQARLLRVLQERKVVPLGGSRATDFDVNLICATHRNLRELMDQKAFRDDLYYRINGISVTLPPLRDRTDLAALCQKILRGLSPLHNLSIQATLLETFLRYSWPGNLRQLSNVLKTASVLAENDHEITTAHLADDFLEDLTALIPQALPKVDVVTFPTHSRPVAGPPAIGAFSGKWGTLKAAPAQTSSSNNLEQVEITAIMRVLNTCAGNVSMAAKQLNISRNTIYRKLKKSG